MKNNKHSIITLRSIHSPGFTLVELMITVAISGIVLGALYTAYLGQQQSYLAQEQVAETQQSIRAGLSIMEREIRMAGFDPRQTTGAGFITANANSMVFSLVADNDGSDNDNDGTTDETDELQTVWYDLYDAFADGDLDLGRRDGPMGGVPPNRQAVAENIDAIEFFYTMADGSQTTVPAPLTEIRSVQISILARAARRDPALLNNQSYIPASGTVPWAVVNDNFRRRLLISTIQCRNMGL